jgi:hypothetical protein
MNPDFIDPQITQITQITFSSFVSAREGKVAAQAQLLVRSVNWPLGPNLRPFHPGEFRGCGYFVFVFVVFVIFCVSC